MRQPIAGCSSPSDCPTSCIVLSVQWLAVHAWNTGGSLARPAGQPGTAGQAAEEFRALAVQLQEACAPAGAAQLRRMRASLAAADMAGRLGQEPTELTDPAAVPAASNLAATMQAAALPAGVTCSSDAVAPVQPADAAPGATPAQEPVPAAEAGAEEASGSIAASPAGAAVPAASMLAVEVQPHSRGATRCSPSGSAAAAGSCIPAAPAGAQQPQLMASAEQPGHTQQAPADHTAPQPAVLPMPAAAATESQPELMDAAPAIQQEGNGEDSLSEDSADEGPTWLDAVFAAQKRVFGGGAAAGGQAKRQAVQGPHGSIASHARPQAPAAFAVQQLAGRKQQQQSQPQQQSKPAPSVAEDDGADALSLGDSMGGSGGFMGL